MERREFILLVGGTATLLPLTARARSPAMPVVGILGSGSPNTDSFRVAAVRDGLLESDYTEGKNLEFEYRWAEDDYNRLPALASELVRSDVALIAAIGGITSALAVKSANATIPIVFEAGGDPVKTGLVTSLSHPGGNITGVTSLIGVLVAKQFEILRDAVEKSDLIGFLVNPNLADAAFQTKDALSAAESVGQKMSVVQARTDDELASAFDDLAQQKASALVVGADPFFIRRRDMIVRLAERAKLPTIYSSREYVTAGGLMSYGTSLTELHRMVGVYAGRILKGERPGDLPVQQSTRVELVVNLKCAKALGFTVPLPLMARADEFVE